MNLEEKNNILRIMEKETKQADILFYIACTVAILFTFGMIVAIIKGYIIWWVGAFTTALCLDVLRDGIKSRRKFLIEKERLDALLKEEREKLNKEKQKLN